MSASDIIAAAEALAAQGRAPSIRAVRESLGGGSFSTICDALRPWREGKARAERERQEAVVRDLQDHKIALELAARNEAMLRQELAQLRRERERGERPMRGLAGS